MCALEQLEFLLCLWLELIKSWSKCLRALTQDSLMKWGTNGISFMPVHRCTSRATIHRRAIETTQIFGRAGAARTPSPPTPLTAVSIIFRPLDHGSLGWSHRPELSIEPRQSRRYILNFSSHIPQSPAAPRPVMTCRVISLKAQKVRMTW